MRVGIVGAGWAGLAAASQCVAHNIEVTLFDAAHSPGGRARGVIDPKLGELDNGQHLFIGAYDKTRSILSRDLGKECVESSFHRLPLWLQSVDNQFVLRHTTSHTRSILNDIRALWSAKGLGIHDKWRVAALLWRLKRGIAKPFAKHDTSLTVAQWLRQERQTATACRWLWYPLCLATMNTSPDQACATLFQNVVRDSLMNSQPGAADLLLPTQNLSDLWPRHVAKQVSARWGHVVRHIKPDTDRVLIDDEQFDACILAVPPTSLARLVSPIPGFERLASEASQFEFRSIATCYVMVDRHFPLPAPLLMFDHGTGKHGRQAQWVFDRHAFMRKPTPAQLAFVISCAESVYERDGLSLAHELVSELKQALPTYTGKVIGARCFHEKRATFAALPNLSRPNCNTPSPRIFLAGDWTDTGYPAVIEGAVSSGMRAVEQLIDLDKN